MMFWKKKQAGPPAYTVENVNYHAVALTDTGSSRAHNEDAVRFVRPADKKTRQTMGCLAIVADGMGGHASGEVASTIAIETISEEYYRHHQNPVKALKQAGTKANEEIWNLANRNKKLKGMGTTCTAVALVNNHIYVSHIGDSRAYLFKNGEMIQLSEDHTYVQQLLNSGELSPFEARHHPDGNILTKSLGTAKKRSCDVFLSEHRFEDGDKLLLCSDGLYEYFSSQELAVFLTEGDLGEISQKLSASVLDRGAHDNFTILLLASKKQLSENSAPTRAITVAL